MTRAAYPGPKARFAAGLWHRRLRSIGARLALAYAATTIVTISLLFMIGYELLRARLIAGLDLLNTSEFQQVQNHLGNDYANLTPAVVEQRIRETTEDASVLFYINIQGNASRGFFRSSNLDGANIPDVPGLQHFNVTMAGIGDLRVGEFVMKPFDVEIATPLAQVQDLLSDYVEVSLGLIGLLALASVPIGLSLTRLVLGPLRAIQETATRIGSDNLSARIPVSKVDDELTNLARLLNQMFDRLETSFAQVRRFAGEASHELKTALSLIQLHTEKLVVSEDLTPSQQDVVHDQLEELTRLNRILDGLLFLSRAEANAVTLRIEPQDVPQFLAAFQIDASALSDHQGCRYTSLHHGDSIAGFDRALLRRVLLNLLANALKASPPGGCIALNSRIDDAGWRVSLEDEGPGLSAEQRERVFERFVRLTPPGCEDSGSGLGLSICRSIIQLHRGRITLSGRQNASGLCVTILLPIAHPGQQSAGHCRI